MSRALVVLALFGFIGIALSASLTRSYDCTRDDDAAMKLIGMKCKDLWDQSRLVFQGYCGRDDVMAICRSVCGTGVCWDPTSGAMDCEGDECNSGSSGSSDYYGGVDISFGAASS